jgi:replicative DNA helicase Mcm
MFPVNIKLHNIKAEKHEGKIITFNSDIVSVDEKETVSLQTSWLCLDCGEERTIGRVTYKVCLTCQSTNVISRGIISSESIQRVLLREPMDEAKNSTQQTFVGEIHSEYVGNVYMGDKKKVTGVFRSVPLQKKFGTSQRNMPTIDIVSLEPADKIRTMLPTPELLERLKTLIKEDKLVELMTKSFAYHIYGNKEQKLSLILSMIGGSNEGESRGSIHVLLIGDPSTSKSETAKKVINVSHKAMFTTGKGSTGAGLVMGMEKLADGRLIPQMGPVALCHKGHVVIDEFDKMDDKDRGYLHEVMEQQMISFAKGGKYLRIPAQTTIIACANPKFSRWDEELSIHDNLPFPASLLSRFDLKFRYLDRPNFDLDTAISDHVMKMREGRPSDLLSEDDIMAFINHARMLTPKITPDAKKRAMDFYVKLRNNKDNVKDSITIDHRQFEGLIRISTAYAKFHFRSVVDIDCVEKSIDLYKSSLESFGMSVNGGGMTQAGIVDYHIKNATNFGKREHVIHKLFHKLADPEDGLVVKSDLIDLIKEEGLFEDIYKMEQMISLLEKNGVLTTRGNCYKWTG